MPGHAEQPSEEWLVGQRCRPPPATVPTSTLTWQAEPPAPEVLFAAQRTRLWCLKHAGEPWTVASEAAF